MKVDVNVEKFYKALNRALSTSKEQATYIVKEASKFFIQSASKATAPDAGKNIAKRRFKRTMEKLTGFNLADGSIGWRKDGERKRKNDFVIYKVLFKNSYSKGRKFFKDKGEAEDFQKIKYRGIGRAGWSVALSKLGFGFTKGISSEIQAKAGEINETRQRLNVDNPGIEITNLAKSVSSHSPLSASLGLSRAANRVNAITKQIEKRIADSGNK